MAPLKYLGRVWTFAFQKFTIRTDSMQIVAASMLPLAAPYLGIKNPSQASSEVLAYIGMVALALIVIRLVMAPYFIWKEDQAEIARLHEEAHWAERREDEASLQHRIALRQELSACMAKLVSFANYSGNVKAIELMYGTKGDYCRDTLIRIHELVSELSYDVALRVTSLNLVELCQNIIEQSLGGNDVKPLLERLWRQRKLTFKLLQCHDDINDLMTMVEIENLISEWGESFQPNPTDEIKEAHNLLLDLQRMMKEHGPELNRMGRQPNLGSRNRTKYLQ